MLDRLRRLALDSVRDCWHYRSLIPAMVSREIAARYRGSLLGGVWVIISPLLMLAVYAFVFGLIFQVRWGGGDAQQPGFFTAALFCGITAFGLFAEVLGRAPVLVVSHPSYVTKVVFPLEILSIACVVSASLNFLIGMALLCVFLLLSGIGLSVSMFALPLLVLPYLALLLGVALFLSALGVYVRDITHVSGFLTTALLFLSPVFYPVTAVPEAYRSFLYLNPLTYMVEAFREISVFGRWPDVGSLAVFWCVAAVVLLLGMIWFRKLRQGFADVL